MSGARVACYVWYPLLSGVAIALFGTLLAGG